MLRKQNSRALLIQGLAYGLAVSGTLWIVAGALREPFSEPYQLLALLSALLSYFAFRRIDMTESWQPGRPGALGTQMFLHWL